MKLAQQNSRRVEAPLLIPSTYQSNAAPEWQAMSLGRRSRELVAACPLEGLVRLRDAW
jgi:hypothetical protein